ncbi:MAG: radical SAM protein [Candidatus Omnitrophica bacterium]|nr:radical SAM protein [Candidatus Omnitrophota bacterium]
MRVLMICPPYRLSLTNFPLGLAYIAAAVLKRGHEVSVIDMDAYNYPMDEYVRRLKEFEYDVLCVGGMITAWNFIEFTVNTVKRLKPEVKIVVGGGIISSTPESFISRTQADVGVIGEGEETMVELLDVFERGKSLDTVTGIVFRDHDGSLKCNPDRPAIKDPDTIPFPAWDHFEVAKLYSRYPSHHSLLRATRQLTIYTSRGCPYQCTFCYTEKQVRQRSIDNLMAEIEELKGRYGVRFFLIADDLFVVKRDRTIRFCEEMIRRKMNVRWSATGRCNLVDAEFLRLMKAAGCEFMGLGIESGSASVLKAIKKNQTPEQIVKAVKMVSRAGIVPGGTFILGLPPETPQTVRETVEVYKKINSYRTHVNRFFYATPYPGTPLYDEMVAKGKIKDQIAFFRELSRHGDAVDFVINCTEAFGDEELRKTKENIEKEVFKDFVQKHPVFALRQFLSQKTFWRKVETILIRIKMRGLRDTLEFLWIKLKVKLKLIPDPYTRRWAEITQKNYHTAQNMVEGDVPTF